MVPTCSYELCEATELLDGYVGSCEIANALDDEEGDAAGAVVGIVFVLLCYGLPIYFCARARKQQAARTTPAQTFATPPQPGVAPCRLGPSHRRLRIALTILVGAATIHTLWVPVGAVAIAAEQWAESDRRTIAERPPLVWRGEAHPTEKFRVIFRYVYL